MVNDLRGDVEMFFNGKNYVLFPSMASTYRLEQVFGEGSISSFLQKVQSSSETETLPDVKISLIVGILHALLKDEGLSEEDIFEGVMNDGVIDVLVSCIIPVLISRISGAKLEKAPTSGEDKPQAK